MSFRVECKVGKSDDRRWSIVAEQDEAGAYPLRLDVLNQEGNVIDSAQSTVHVVPQDAGRDQNISLLIIGDSLTNATAYPNEIARLLSTPGNPQWKMLGTNRPESAAEKVVHDGYSGWTWKRFRTQWDPENPQPGKSASSPYLFVAEDEVPYIDMRRYFAERCEGEYSRLHYDSAWDQRLFPSQSGRSGGGRSPHRFHDC